VDAWRTRLTGSASFPKIPRIWDANLREWLANLREFDTTKLHCLQFALIRLDFAVIRVSNFVGLSKGLRVSNNTPHHRETTSNQANMNECPKCHGRMSEGFVLDHGDYNAKKLQEWIEGEPVKSFWHGYHTKDREAFVVKTFRCERCGFLESYAQTPAE
jgi:hypothetical protein